MKKLVIASAVVATTVSGAGAFLLPAAGHSAAVTHTIRFTATAQKQANLSKTTFAQDEIDRNKAGRIIGFDVINGMFNPTTHKATGHVAFSNKGGILYGALRFSSGTVTTGKVTGGTGVFHGATGTIYGKTINKAGTKTRVTVTYQN